MEAFLECGFYWSVLTAARSETDFEALNYSGQS
jgi:hypothetical protein